MEEMVSVIVPTYNREPYIGRAIQSILRQTYDKYEIIVVDDGSTDNTQEVMQRLQEQEDRIRYIRMERNQGANYARNIGIQEAKYDYIAFLDSDDEWLPDKLQLQMDKMMNSPEETGLVYCRMRVVDLDGNIYICPRPNIPKIDLEGNVFRPLLTRNVIGTPTILVRRKCIEQVGGFKESLQCLQDWEWVLRIARNWSIGFVEEILVDAHAIQGGVSQNFGANLVTRCYLVSLYREEMRKAGSLDSISQNILKIAKYHGVKEEIEELLRRDFTL